jgi:hypothetical protein
MEEKDPARTALNVILALAAGAAVYTVLRSPALRATAWRALRRSVTVTLPGFFMYQVREAWAASAEQPVRE